MRALVTGATGFVGHCLVRQLETAGHQCRCLVRSRHRAKAIPALARAELIEGDITDPTSLLGMARGVDYVFHLAAMGHVSAVSKQAFRQFHQVNVQGAKNVVESCAAVGVVKLVHFSSTAALGLIHAPVVDETTPCQPATPYQRSKRHGEAIVLSTAQEKNVPVVIVRPCMVIGAGGHGEFQKFVRLMARGLFPKVGRGANLTPAIHVRDVARGAMLAAERGIPGEVYLLVGGSYPMDEIRRLVVRQLGISPRYPYVPTYLAFAGAWVVETLARITRRTPIVTRRNIASTVADRVFSIEKAKKQLDFSPQVGLEEAICETVAWYQTRGIV
jgi:nucleoside-diphosphate-sugar epimerase